LILDNNDIRDLSSNFSPIPTLSTLWINNNHIHHLKPILRQIETLFPNLKYLSLLGSRVYNELI